MCWICYCLESEDRPNQPWVSPCKCSGSAKWVHEECLQQWLDEKQCNNASTPVYCRACGHQYEIEYPPAGELSWFSLI